MWINAPFAWLLTRPVFFWYANVSFTIFAPYLLLSFYFFATYLQGANFCKSILFFRLVGNVVNLITMLF